MEKFIDIDGTELTVKFNHNGNHKSYFNDKGQYHRLSGPALLHSNGTEVWYYEGNFHRFNGPAVRRADGVTEYWIFGRKFSKAEFDAITGFRNQK